MKKYIVIIQTPAREFKKLILSANNKNELYQLYKDLGTTVYTAQYSKHNNKMADDNVVMYNNI